MKFREGAWSLPSPEGRGWPAAGVFFSRSEPGEGSLAQPSLRHRELQLIFRAVDADQAHADSFPEAKGALRVLADDGAQAFAIDVRIVVEVGERDEALHEEVRQFHEKPLLDQADDERLKLIADVLRHEGDFLPFHQLALGIGGAALRFGGFKPQGVQFLRMHKRRTR